MSRPDKQLNDVTFWKDVPFQDTSELTSKNNCYFSGAEQSVLFFEASEDGTLDVDVEIEGNWIEILAGVATVANVFKVIRIQYALYGQSRIKLRWTPDAAPGTLSAWGTAFPRLVVGSNFNLDEPSSIHT